MADTVAREKGIDREEVIEAMEQAIQKAGRSKYGHELDIRAYGEAHGVSFDNWSFLGGEPATVDAVVRSYHVGKTRTADGEIEHLVVAFLINGHGRILRRYMGMSDEAEAIAGDLIAAAMTKGTGG